MTFILHTRHGTVGATVTIFIDEQKKNVCARSCTVRYPIILCTVLDRVLYSA